MKESTIVILICFILEFIIFGILIYLGLNLDPIPESAWWFR